MPRYRIKKVGKPIGDNKMRYRYFVQCKYIWVPFWLTEHDDEDYEKMRKKMEDLISIATMRKTVSLIYHTSEEPVYLPKEQIDRFHEEKNKHAQHDDKV